MIQYYGSYFLEMYDSISFICCRLEVQDYVLALLYVILLIEDFKVTLLIS